MEEHIVTITVRTKGEKCELSTEEIREWYCAKVAGLFDPQYGTPEIAVDVQRKDI